MIAHTSHVTVMRLSCAPGLLLGETRLEELCCGIDGDLSEEVGLLRVTWDAMQRHS